MSPVATVGITVAACLSAALLMLRRRTHRPVLRGDTAIRTVAGLTTVGLLGIAGAISYQHLLTLALEHGQHGWLGHAFPLSVDGVEIVASLRLLSDRRSRTRSGWLPWTALGIGTGFSLFANVATAQPAPIARVIAGWPAVAFLIAVKLLSGLLDQHSPESTVDDAAPTVPLPVDDANTPNGSRAVAGVDEIPASDGDASGRRVGADLPIDLMRRIPIHHEGYRRWQTQWSDLQVPGADPATVAA